MKQFDSTLNTRFKSSLKSNIFGRPLLLPISLIFSAIIARVLGPYYYAILVTIRSLSQTLSVIFDFGFSQSLAKISNELSLEYEKTFIIKAIRKINFYRIGAITFFTVALIFLSAFIELSIFNKNEIVMYILCYFLAITSIISNTQKFHSAAALKNKELLQVEIILSIIDPLLIIASFYLFQNMVLVAVFMAISNIINYILMKQKADFDIYNLKNSTTINIKILLKKFYEYITLNYIKTIFNKFLFRISFLVWIFVFLKVENHLISNASIALAIVFQAWQLANIPLSQIRAPLISRFFKLKKFEELSDLQYLSINILCVSSCILVIILASIGNNILLLLYGSNYEMGCFYGVVIAIISLIGSFFSLGNNTLQQFNIFKIQLISLFISLLFIMISIIIFLNTNSQNYQFLFFILPLARVIFWIITDIYADFVIFNYKLLLEKFKYILNILLCLLFIYLLKYIELNNIMILILSLIIFYIFFKIMNGTGIVTKQFLVNKFGINQKITKYI